MECIFDTNSGTGRLSLPVYGRPEIQRIRPLGAVRELAATNDVLRPNLQYNGPGLSCLGRPR